MASCQVASTSPVTISPPSSNHTPRDQQRPPNALPQGLIDQAFQQLPPSTSTSGSSTPAGTHTLVPAYPYNTSLAPFLSPASGLGGNTPDDSDVTTNLPSVQVDYLSHEWQEEDIWSSWKATTKHKAQLVNGLRLENASWRTWNKQRNNLKTISPETLNWLKDSDVTWLYGPLHTASTDLVPNITKEAKAEDRLGLDTQVEPRKKHTLKARPKTMSHADNVNARKTIMPKKPILKYRSLSDILTVPNFSRPQIDSPEQSDASGQDTPEGSRATTPLHEPSLEASTRPHFVDGSDGDASTSYFPSRSTRAGLSHMPSTSSTIGDELSDANASASEGFSETDSISRSGRRRHIAFSNRVEQCIAVDSDEDRQRYSQSPDRDNTPRKFGAALQRAPSNPSSRASYFNRSSSDEDEDDSDSSDESDDNDKLLTFRSSRSSSLVSTSSFYGGYAAHHAAHSPDAASPTSSNPSTGNVTIAKLAPTILKNSEQLPSPSPAVIFSPIQNELSLPDVEVSTRHYTYPDVSDYKTPVYTYPQQQQLGARRSSEAQSSSSSYSDMDSSPMISIEQDEYSTSSHNEYSGSGGIAAGDADYSLAEDYSANDNAGSGSLYASYDPVPKGHYAHQSTQSTSPKAAVVPPPPAAATTNPAVARSILKPRGKPSPDSIATLPTQSGSPLASPALNADQELESRGRSLSRGSSSSSLDARSASRGVSVGSSCSPSTEAYSPVTDTPKRVRAPRKELYRSDSSDGMDATQSATLTGARSSHEDEENQLGGYSPTQTSRSTFEGSQSGKGNGEDSSRQSPRQSLPNDANPTTTTTTPPRGRDASSRHQRQSSSISSLLGNWSQDRERGSPDKRPPSVYLDVTEPQLDQGGAPNATAATARSSLLKNQLDGDETSPKSQDVSHGAPEASEASGLMGKAADAVASGFDLFEAMYNIGVGIVYPQKSTLSA